VGFHGAFSWEDRFLAADGALAILHFLNERRQYELDEISVKSRGEPIFSLIFIRCSMDFFKVKEKMGDAGRP
jgi:hypothetical protein